MINIITLSMRVQRGNREGTAGIVFVACLAVIILCSVVVYLLTVKVSAVQALKDFHYMVSANDLEFNLIPEDVIRIVKTPAKRAFTGEEIEILKVYTNKGFVYATPDDSFYDAIKSLAGAADWDGLMAWQKKGVSLPEVQQKAYAIGTSERNTFLIFLFLSLQNLSVIIAGIALLILIFPISNLKDREESRIIARVDQPAK